MLKFKGDATEVVDLGGKTLLPGFIDAHGHVFNVGVQAVAANLLAPPDGQVTDIASLQATLRAWAETFARRRGPARAGSSAWATTTRNCGSSATPRATISMRCRRSCRCSSCTSPATSPW